MKTISRLLTLALAAVLLLVLVGLPRAARLANRVGQAVEAVGR